MKSLLCYACNDLVNLFAGLWLNYFLKFCRDWQEGAEEEADNDNNNEDIPDPLLADTEDKNGQEREQSRKTSKYMTKYERARILGTRALQIRF